MLRRQVVFKNVWLLEETDTGLESICQIFDIFNDFLGT